MRHKKANSIKCFVKCLAFPFWAAWNNFQAGNGWSPYKTTKNFLSSDSLQMEPRIGKPGWYYNRISKECWYEFPDNTAWTAKTEDFVYHFNLMEYNEHPLSSVEIDAIRILYMYGNIDKNTISNLLFYRNLYLVSDKHKQLKRDIKILMRK